MVNRTPYIITFGMVTCVLVAFNWVYDYREVVRQSAQAAVAEHVDISLPELSPASVAMGGWPAVYLVSIARTDLPTVTSFSLSNLLIDVFCGMMVTMAVMILEVRLLKRWRSTTNIDACPDKPRKSETVFQRRFTLLDLLLSTALIAFGAAYWRAIVNQSQRELQLATQIGKQGGQAVETLSLAAPMAKCLPSSWHHHLRRVTEVTLTNPDSSMVEAVMTLPYLSKLMIGGGNYDLQILECLRTKPLLTHLRLSGRVLDSATIETVASLPQLQSLCLLRTNVTDQTLACIDGLSHLQALNVIHTDVKLQNVNELKLAKNIKVLAIGHPTSDQSAAVEISNWPLLTRLICNEYDEPINRSSMELTIEDTPELVEVSLDRMQKFNLSIRRAPKLRNVKQLNVQAELRVLAGSQIIPGLALGVVTLQQTPKLQQLDCAGLYLEQVKLSAANDLQLNILGNPQGTLYIEDTRLLRLISSLAGDAGPTQLNFENVSFDGTDLKPLLASQRIRSLKLQNCEISGDQLASLCQGNSALGDSAIETLNLCDNELTWPDLAKLVQFLPKLRILRHNAEILNLSLVNMEHLESILLDASNSPLDQVELVNLPLLKDELQLRPEVHSIRLQNIPAVTGISTQAPWPVGAKLSGVRDLKYFTAGGPGLDDAVFQELLACQHLESLTLVNTSISHENLRSIVRWPAMKHLALIGEQVNGTIVDSVASLSNLESLSLDGASMTDDQLDAICRLPHLKHLSLMNVDLSTLAISKIAMMKQLVYFGCGGPHVTTEHLQHLGSLESVCELNLSNSRLDASALAIVQKMPRLNTLLLRGCELDGPSLLTLARQRRCQMDIANSDLPVEIILALENGGLLISSPEVGNESAWGGFVEPECFYTEY